MNFLIDAQLPRRLAVWLAAQGHDALHTLDLPSGNAATDRALAALAKAQNRVMVTKDADFVQMSFVDGFLQILKMLAITSSDGKFACGRNQYGWNVDG